MKSNNNNNNNGQSNSEKPSKPHFRPAQDDTKPVLQDPVLSLSLSLSLNFYVNIWPVVVSIDMGFSYFVFFDIIILCVCGTIHFVIYINIENFQYCRGFWRYKPLLQDQLLSL